jgi:hypothetical protein
VARAGPGHAEVPHPAAARARRLVAVVSFGCRLGCGRSFAGITGLGDLLSYLFGPGLDNEPAGRHVNPRVVAVWAYATAGNLADLQPPPANGRPSARRLTELLEQPARICGNLPNLPVRHCSIHNHPDDPILTDQHWEHIALPHVTPPRWTPADHRSHPHRRPADPLFTRV